MIPTNDNPYGRSYASLTDAFDALALDGAMVFLLRRFKGQGWRLDIRRPR